MMVEIPKWAYCLHKKTLLGEETWIDDGIFLDQTTGLREHGWMQKPSPNIAPFYRMDVHNPCTHSQTHIGCNLPQCEYHLFITHQWTVNVNSMYSQIMDEVLMWIPPPIPNHGWSVDVNTTTYSQSWMKCWCEYHHLFPIMDEGLMWILPTTYQGLANWNIIWRITTYSGHAFMERESSFIITNISSVKIEGQL
jgi:hypothetical protein